MSLRPLRFDDADWRPHPVALAVYVAGVALLAWGVFVYAQMPSGEGGAGPRTDPWRPAVSKWSRAPATDAQRISTASTSVDGAPTAAPAAPTVGKAPD